MLSTKKRSGVRDVAVVSHCVREGDGQGYANLALVRALRAQGYRVHVVGIEITPVLRGIEGIYIHRFPCINSPNIVRSVYFMIVASLYVWFRRFDIVHNNGVCILNRSDFNTCQFVHSAYRLVANSHSDSHGLASAYYHAYVRFHSLMERHVYRRSRIILAVSGMIGDELVRLCDVDPATIVVIPNGVDTTRFHPAADEAERDMLRQRFGFTAQQCVALFVGDLRNVRKGFDTALQALQGAPDNIILVAVGEVGDGHFVREVAARGLDSRVRLLGFRTDVPEMMRAADIFLFPTRYEACSLAVLEAFASGLPVITSARAGSHELLQHGIDSIIVQDPEDVQGFSDALTTLGSAESIRDALSHAAVRRAPTLSWDGVCARILALYPRPAVDLSAPMSTSIMHR